jgi:ribonuclease D
MEPELNNLVWVARTDELARMVNELSQETLIGVDTESNSLFAYQEQVCLIQFSTAQIDYLVDPLALNDLSSLGPIFADPKIEKIFHAAEYDLVCLKRDFEFTFNNLFDTMLAARILGRSGLGLGSMLVEEFGVDVDKRYQRADWSKRPISTAMMNYARMDTHYLIKLRDILRKQLVDAGRWDLAQEDFQRLTQVHAGVVHENGANYWKISGAQDLSPRQAAVLLNLCQFRDEQAQAINQPAFRVLPNQALLELAQLMPRKRSELNQVAGLSQKLIQRYGSGLLAAVERGVVGPPAYRPYSPRPDDQLMWRLEALRNWRKSTARALGVESDVILPRDIMEVIAERNPRNFEELSEIMTTIPWRLNRFGKQILELVG